MKLHALATTTLAVISAATPAALSLATPAATAQAGGISATTIGAQEHPITHMLADPKGEVLYTADEGGNVQAWSRKRGELLWSTEAHPAKQALAAFGIGDEELIFSIGIVAAMQLDRSTGAKLGNNVGGPNALQRCVAVLGDPKSRWVWLGTAEGVMTRVVPGNVNAWSKRPMNNAGITCMTLGKDAGLIAVGGKDKTIRFINAKSANVDDKKVLEGHESPISAVAFDAKAKYVFSGDERGFLCATSVSSRKKKFAIDAHEARIHSIASDPRGKWVATGSADGSIKLWETKKGESILTLSSAEAKPIVALVVLDKGKTLASAGGGERITLWDLSSLK